MSSDMMIVRGRLYKASVGGDITSLLELLEEDPLILERVITTFTETPLHIAAMFGHVDFANELLRCKPDLTTELDSHGFSPLHLAASRKNINMVKMLLAAGNPDVCSITDKEGRTPLHLAAMKGRIEAMNELINTRPEAIHVVADQGETILHLCVKHNRFEPLKLLLEELDSNGGVLLDDSSTSCCISINSKDGDGNTILHLAVANKHWKMIHFLLNNNNSSTKGIEVNALNNNGYTCLDVLILQSVRDLKDIEIRELLNSAGCVRASGSSPANNVYVSPLQVQQQIPQIVLPTTNIDDDEKFAKWLEKTRSSLMVVASLIATMAFQTGLSPPGGFWESDSPAVLPPNGKYIPSHRSGKSILAAEGRDKDLYSKQVLFNTIGFLASLSIILFLISGLPLRRRLYVWIPVVIMWIAITSMTLSFSTILEITRECHSKAAGNVICVWMVLMCLIAVLHFCRLTRRCFSKYKPINYMVRWLFKKNHTERCNQVLVNINLSIIW